MLAFSGFNGFGQFDDTERRADQFKSFSVDDTLPRYSTSDKLSISCAWLYTAFAVGKNVMLKGLLDSQPNGIFCFSTPDVVKQLAAGSTFCLILLQNGRLYKLLPQLHAELREIVFSDTARTHASRKRTALGDTKFPSTVIIEHIAMGAKIAVALSSTNDVYNIPSRIHQFSENIQIRQLVCGFEHALLLTNDGDVYSWGNGLRGQLGLESLESIETPLLIDALAGIKIIHIAAGGWHSAAISSFGDLYTWGSNSNFQLGLRTFNTKGIKEQSVYPVPNLPDLPKVCVCQSETCSALKVFTGVRHSILQMSCGNLWAFGWNSHGQLGFNLDNNKEASDSFKKVVLSKARGTELNIVPGTHLNVVCGPWSTVIYNS